MATIRNASVLLGGKKIAEIESAELKINGNGEAAIVDGLYLGTSKGVITTTISCNSIRTVSSSDGGNAIEDAVLAQRDVEVQWVGGGRIMQLSARAMSYGESSTSSSGMLKGSYEFAGGTPEKLA